MTQTIERQLEKLVIFQERLEKERAKDPDRPLIELLETQYVRLRGELADVMDVTEEAAEARIRRERFGPAPGDEDWVPEDDAVIGRAFRGSLLVLVAVGVLALVFFLFSRRTVEAPPTQAIADAAPVVLEDVPAPERPVVSFTDSTAESGIDYVHHNGAYGDKLLPETMGGGGAFTDLDGDGDPDLLVVDGSDWPHRSAKGNRGGAILYENDGSGSFRRTAEGLGAPLYGQGVVVGDYDNDGRTDIFLTAVGANRLLRNTGAGFEDVTARAGVGGGEDTWSTAAAFVDVDNDGDLDLFVGNYVEWSKEIDFEVDYRLTGLGRAYGPPANYQGTYSYLYRNEGDGSFRDISAESGIQVNNPVTGAPSAKVLGVAPVDVDADGWIDLLVANDTVGNFFFRNQGDGTFSEEGSAAGVAYDRMGSATGAMGIDSGDFRNDGELGFVIGNFANEMTSLFVSQGDPGLFADEAIGTGIGASSRTALTFGLFWFDYDLDGRLDLLQTNGHLEEDIASVDSSQNYRQAAQLFWNAGPEQRQSFVPVPAEELGDFAQPIVGRGSAFADLEGDGDLDVVLFQVAGPPLLLRNEQGTGHHFLRVRLQGDPAAGSSRDAYGAWIELEAGGVLQRRQVMPTKSYLSQSERVVTFGLGAVDRVDSLTVRWPGGGVQELGPVEEVDGTLTVHQSALSP
ncbi:MAG: CRTAC1 family protein [Acidobacteriota bacterium]